MMGLNYLGMLSVVPATGLLTISFFVLVVVNMIKKETLKSFGRIIAMLLWVSAAIVFSIGMYIISTDNCPMTRMLERCGLPPIMRMQMMPEYMDKSKIGKMHHGMMEKMGKGMMQEPVEEPQEE